MKIGEKGSIVPATALRTLILAILLALFGAPALAQEAAPQDAESAAAAQAGEGETVIQVGEGEAVTRAEFEQEFERATRAIALQQGMPYNEQTRELFERFRVDFLEQLAVRNALLAEAEARNIAVSEQEVDQQVTQLRDELGEERFQQVVQELGYDSVEAFRESVRQGLLTQRVLDELRAGIEVSDDQIQAYYDENQDQFAGQQLDQVREQVETRVVDQLLTERFAGLQEQHGIETFPERIAASGQEEGVAGGGAAAPPQPEEPAEIETPAGEANGPGGAVDGDVVAPENEQSGPETEVDPNAVPAVEDVEERQEDPDGQEAGDDRDDR